MINDVNQTNYTMEVNNIANTLFKLFEKKDPLEYNATTFNFLKKAIASRNLINRTINDSQLAILIAQQVKAKEAFDNLQIDEALEENESDIINQTLSQQQPNTSNDQAQSQSQNQINQVIHIQVFH